MKIEPLKFDPVAFGIGQSHGTRDPGLHMSDIYNAYFKRKEPARYGRGGKPPIEFLELGLAFESMIEEGIKGRIKAERPGELSTTIGLIPGTHQALPPGHPDGTPLHFNPDLFFYNGIMRVGEIKYTTMSTNGTPEEEGDVFDPKFDKYMVQMMGYCYALNTVYGRLIAMFSNGDYTRPYIPQLRMWDIEFSEMELEENWNMLANFANEAGMLDPSWQREEY